MSCQDGQNRASNQDTPKGVPKGSAGPGTGFASALTKLLAVVQREQGVAGDEHGLVFPPASLAVHPESLRGLAPQELRLQVGDQRAEVTCPASFFLP